MSKASMRQPDDRRKPIISSLGGAEAAVHHHDVGLREEGALLQDPDGLRRMTGDVLFYERELGADVPTELLDTALCRGFELMGPATALSLLEAHEDCGKCANRVRWLILTDPADDDLSELRDFLERYGDSERTGVCVRRLPQVNPETEVPYEA